MSGYGGWQGFDPFLETTTTGMEGRRSPYSSNNTNSLLGGGSSSNPTTATTPNSPCFETYDPSVLLASGSSDGRTSQQQQAQLRFGFGTQQQQNPGTTTTQHLYHPSTGATQRHHQHHHQVFMSALAPAATAYTPHSMAVTTTTTTINHLDLGAAAAAMNPFLSAAAPTAGSLQQQQAQNPFAAASTSSSNDPLQLFASSLQDSASHDPLLFFNNTGSSDIGTTTPPPAPASGGIFASITNNDITRSRNDILQNSAQDDNHDEDDDWLDEIQMHVSSLSLEPLSGKEILKRVKESVKDVTSRYIPCVDFLVHCQQDLRKGLAQAQQHRSRYHHHHHHRRGANMTPNQFYRAFVQPLPDQFWSKSSTLMDPQPLQQAMKGLQTLLHDASKEKSSCEAVKNQFLGGMKDGESWGLRKWLSRNGNALQICTNLECLTHAVQQQDKNAEATQKLAAALRPLASAALQRLKNDIPASYQEVSAAHPYLPFFHRLESALRTMSNYDPTDDDVICIDDDDDDDDVVEVVKPPPKKKAAPKASSRKRKREVIDYTQTVDSDDDDNGSSSDSAQQQEAAVTTNPVAAPAPAAAKDDSSSSGEEDEASDVEIIVLNSSDDGGDSKPAAATQRTPAAADLEDWMCPGCFTFCSPGCAICVTCGKERPDDFQAQLDSLEFDDDNNDNVFGSEYGSDALAATPPPPPMTWPAAINEVSARTVANAMADNLGKLAFIFEQNQQDLILPMSSRQETGAFWDGDRYGAALRVFGNVLQSPDCCHFVERVHEDMTVAGKQYSHVVRNPLCFRDIVAALIVDEENPDESLPSVNSGKLPPSGLKDWNMWRGVDLLQAIDLVLLNSLAYGKAIDEGKSSHRSLTNKLRKLLWNGISSIVTQHVGQDSERRRQCTPVRRSETSGFVVYKIKER